MTITRTFSERDRRAILRAPAVWINCPSGEGWRSIPRTTPFWQGQALDKIMASLPLSVPVMWVQGLWDQEDMWGGIHCYDGRRAERHRQR